MTDDTRDLGQRYRLAISDPGSIVGPREDGETVPNWSTRAVLAVRGEDHDKWGCGDCDAAFRRGVEAGKAERDEELAIPRDEELPGMWEAADFTGGQTEVEAAERRLAELEPLHEWRCPNCGHVTRARMADHEPGAAERKLAAVREECDRITRWAHVEITDGFKLESVLEIVQHIRAALDGENHG